MKNDKDVAACQTHLFSSVRKNHLFSIRLAELMVAVDKKTTHQKTKQNKSHNTLNTQLQSCLHPLQVSSRLFSLPSTSSPTSGLLFWLFSLNKEAERWRAGKGESEQKQRTALEYVCIRLLEKCKLKNKIKHVAADD